MERTLETVLTAIIAFAATNIDDIVVLTVFFSQVNATFRPVNIVLGQYLGILALVGMSLLGFLGSLVIPHQWIGLSGLVPMGIGLYKLLANRKKHDEGNSVPAAGRVSNGSRRFRLLRPETFAVMLATVGNGGDNVGIYTALFAVHTFRELFLITAVFLVLVALWCGAGFALARNSVVAGLLTKYGNITVPFVLIALGLYILVKNGTLPTVW